MPVGALVPATSADSPVPAGHTEDVVALVLAALPGIRRCQSCLASWFLPEDVRKLHGFQRARVVGRETRQLLHGPAHKLGK